MSIVSVSTAWKRARTSGELSIRSARSASAAFRTYVIPLMSAWAALSSSDGPRAGRLVRTTGAPLLPHSDEGAALKPPPPREGMAPADSKSPDSDSIAAISMSTAASSSHRPSSTDSDAAAVAAAAARRPRTAAPALAPVRAAAAAVCRGARRAPLVCSDAERLASGDRRRDKDGRAADADAAADEEAAAPAVAPAPAAAAAAVHRPSRHMQLPGSDRIGWMDGWMDRPVSRSDPTQMDGWDSFSLCLPLGLRSSPIRPPFAASSSPIMQCQCHWSARRLHLPHDATPHPPLLRARWTYESRFVFLCCCGWFGAFPSFGRLDWPVAAATALHSLRCTALPCTRIATAAHCGQQGRGEGKRGEQAARRDRQTATIPTDWIGFDSVWVE